MRRVTAALAAVIILLSVHIIVGQDFPVRAAEELTLRSRFITDFRSSGEGRRENIRLAAAAFNSMRVLPGEQVSFNTVTGERSEARGYRVAKVIENGVYTPGVGGGVCQVSTTLYNALLLADCTVTEVHRHTIQSSYVEPSFDAMVSDWSDLKFVNTTGADIVIATSSEAGDLVVDIYGAPMAYKIVRRSEIVGTVSPAPEKILEDTEGKYQDKVIYREERYVLVNPKKGCMSRGYLIKEYGGKRVSTLIRNDYYEPVQGVVVIGTLAAS